jgi:hypothetical protein
VTPPDSGTVGSEVSRVDPSRWREQYERMKRWRTRLKERGGDDRRDDIYAFSFAATNSLTGSSTMDPPRTVSARPSEHGPRARRRRREWLQASRAEPSSCSRPVRRSRSSWGHARWQGGTGAIWDCRCGGTDLGGCARSRRPLHRGVGEVPSPTGSTARRRDSLTDASSEGREPPREVGTALRWWPRIRALLIAGLVAVFTLAVAGLSCNTLGLWLPTNACGRVHTLIGRLQGW